MSKPGHYYFSFKDETVLALLDDDGWIVRAAPLVVTATSQPIKSRPDLVIPEFAVHATEFWSSE